MPGNRAFRTDDDDPSVVDAERRPRDIGQPLRVIGDEGFHILLGRDQLHQPGNLANRTFDLGVAGMADQDQRPAFGRIAPALDMNFGDQGTGRVDDVERPLLCCLFYRLGDAMRAEDGDAAQRHLVQLVDEDRALGLQIHHHVPIVHDLVPHIDRRAEPLQGTFDDIEGTLHSGAKPSRLS